MTRNTSGRVPALTPAGRRVAIPIDGVTTGLMVTDQTTSHEITRDSHPRISNDFSNAGLGMFGLTAGTMYITGIRTGNDHLHETGLLSMEAGVDALERGRSTQICIPPATAYSRDWRWQLFSIRRIFISFNPRHHGLCHGNGNGP